MRVHRSVSTAPMLAALCLSCASVQEAESTHRPGPWDSLAHWRALFESSDAHFNVVCLGDSNTEVNWTTRGDLNWVGLLSASLFENGAATRYVVVNSGKSGDTATEALARIDRDVLAHDPDLVIICYGPNDADEFPPETTRESMRTLIRRIRAASGTSILMRTSVPIFAADTDTWEHSEVLEETLAGIREVAEEEGVTLVEHHARWMEESQEHPPSHWMYNRLHPNGEGHLRLYREVAPALGLPETFSWERGER